MSTEKPTRAVPAIAQSIDSVLDTPAAKQTLRPLAKLRPSWIGPPPPDRPRTPGVAPAMKQHVNVEYSSPALKPPVYICTSLSDPQWEPVEMQAETGEGGEFKFAKAFDVEEGVYQYKFRLGPGDWWVCDESRPTVDDGVGNKNNLLAVKALQLKADEKDSKSVAASKPPALTTPEQQPRPQSAATPAVHGAGAPTPLPKREAFEPNKGSESQQTPDREVADPLTTELSPDDVEALAQNTDEESGSSDSESSSSCDSEEEMTNSPLLRHESVSPHSVEQEHAPLFRHESIGLGYNHHEPAATTISPTKPLQTPSSPSRIHCKTDVNDPSLEHFPTDHAGILDKIHRASISLPEDETVDDDDFLNSPHPGALSDTSISPPSLPSVQEVDEELERIRQAEEEEYEKEEESGEEMDPLREVESEPEDEDFEPKVHAEVNEIDEVIIVEVIDERRKSTIERLVEKAGGRSSVLSIAMGVVVVAAGVVVAARYL